MIEKRRTITELYKNIEDIDPKFVEIVNENFWKLLENDNKREID